MKQYAVIGLGAFGRRVVEEIHPLGVELIIVDKDRDLIERYKQQASVAYCMDVTNQEIVRKTIPESIDAVIVDLGGRMEASILLTSYLKKIGIREIIVKGESNEHAEILEIVGATRVIFPDREAAKRVVPLLVSTSLSSFLPISRGIVIAEVHVPRVLVGKTLLEADVRRQHGVTIVAMKNAENEEYDLSSTEYRFQPGDILLVTGRDSRVAEFAGIQNSISRKSVKALLARLHI